MRMYFFTGDRWGWKCKERLCWVWGQYAFAATLFSLQCQILPQLPVLLQFNDLSSLQMRKWGMGKQRSPFFTLCTSLWSLSSPSCWGSPIPAEYLSTGSDSLCPTWAAVVCGMCNWLLWALAHCSSVTRGRKYPWEATRGGRRECLNSTKKDVVCTWWSFCEHQGWLALSSLPSSLWDLAELKSC